MHSLVIIKRDGSKEPFIPEKVHKPINWAIEGLEGINISDVEMKLYPLLMGRDSITSNELHELVTKALAGMISEDCPEAAYAAARCVNFQIRKQAYGDYKVPHILDIVKRGINVGLYDPAIISYYSENEWDQINSMIDHDRDYLFQYAGIEQMREKYLVKNRVTNQIIESCQIPYILAGAIAFNSYPKQTRLSWVREFYEVSSTHLISLPTPIMGGVRTILKQYSSCVTIDSGDTLDTIGNADTAIMKYVAERAGLGINVGRNRGLGSSVKNGNVKHTGLIPFIKKHTTTTKSCSKGGIRDGAVTFFYPMWHYEFPELIVLKDNSLTEESTCKSADYCVQLNKYLLQRFLKNENISLFSPHEKETPGLYESFFDKDPTVFAELYEKYEADTSIRRRTYSAQELMNTLVSQRSSTGRIYLMFVDNINKHTPFDAKIYQSNLCIEILLPTLPIYNLYNGYKDGDGEISLCTLAAYNWGKIKSPDQFERLANVTVRFLDAIIDYQEYPVVAAEQSTKARRPLGIGMIGFAHFLAKRGMYYHEASMPLVDEYMEAMAYYTFKANVDLAKEFGAAERSNETYYSRGVTPNMIRPSYLDELLPHKERYDWTTERERAMKYGVRCSTDLAFMPSETSSQLANETNSFKPASQPVISKKSKELIVKQVVPEIAELRDAYDWQWEQKSLDGYLKLTAVIQKYCPQSLSLETSYNPAHTDGKISRKQLISDILLAYKLGHKCLYYNNTRKPGESDFESKDEKAVDEGCESGACKL